MKPAKPDVKPVGEPRSTIKNTGGGYPDAKTRRSFEEILRRKPASHPAEDDALALAMGFVTNPMGNEKTLANIINDDRLVSTGEPVVSEGQADVENASAMMLDTPQSEISPGSPFESLQLKLTQGPLSGMEIYAAMEQGALTLRLSTADQRRLDKLTVNRKRLASVLEDILDCPVVLEVSHVATDHRQAHSSTTA